MGGVWRYFSQKYRDTGVDLTLLRCVLPAEAYVFTNVFTDSANPEAEVQSAHQCRHFYPPLHTKMITELPSDTKLLRK